jgi:hypothetical protein
MLPEVVDEVGPAGACVAGLESGVGGDVHTEPVGQVVLSPRGREVAPEVVEGHLGDLEHAFPAEGHSRQAMARVNMQVTSASVGSGGPAMSRTIAVTARSGSSQRSSTCPLPEDRGR